METDEEKSDKDIKIKITGLRPGEKIEELFYEGNLSGSPHSRIMNSPLLQRAQIFEVL